MAEPFIGQVISFAGNFAPRGWAMCNGQLLAISQYNALFAILGTTYGGDGRTTFALPDLRGRSPMHIGTGGGLPPVKEGQKLGQPTTNLSLGQLPPHNHTVTGTVHVVGGAGTARTPTGGFIAGDSAGALNYAPADATPDGTLSTAAFTAVVGETGSGVPVPIQGPALGIMFIIALEGTFPPRS